MRAGWLLAAALALAACGSEPTRQGDLAALRAAGALFGAGAGALVGVGGGSGAVPPPAAATPEAVAAVLAALPPGPVLRVVLAGSGQSSFAVAVAENGGAVTYATPTGQSITLHDGILIATRGFAGDLMSSDTDALGARIAARSGAEVPRIWRFLDGSDDEVPVEATCRLAREGRETIVLASGARLGTTRMREVCGGAAAPVNRYWVDARGAVQRSAQWAGPALGEMRIEALRD